MSPELLHPGTCGYDAHRRGIIRENSKRGTPDYWYGRYLQLEWEYNGLKRDIARLQALLASPTCDLLEGG